MRNANWSVVLWCLVVLCCSNWISVAAGGSNGSNGDTPVRIDVHDKKDKAPPPQPPPDVRQELHDNCGGDIETFCSNDGPMLAMYCLYSHKDQLSDKCQEYLGSTAVGGCNEDAQNLCGEYDNAEDILSCLEEHRDELSADCLRNIENSARDPWKHLEEATLRSTKVVTVVSLVFLAIPMLLALYAMYHIREHSRLEHEILQQSPKVWKENSEVIEVIRACDSVEEAKAAKHPWCLKFHAIDYWVMESGTLLQPSKSPKKKILSNVSGQFEASKLTAIMGPSGSGKTTLLKLLGGQIFNGEFKGIRAINEMVPERIEYDKLLRAQGFVAQYDCLLPSLTVWQTLRFAALLRLPEEMTVSQKLYRAAHIMDDVGITSIAHNEVGNLNGAQSIGAQTETKSISGGQRRRLSIALELLANPSILLLDEPTSGLDGASTLKIVTSLHKLSRSYDTTICLTIHQPRSEVFDLFDNLFLMGTGGKLVYYGPTAAVVDLFASSPLLQGVDIKLDNPGDFIIDMLNLSDSGLDEQIPGESTQPTHSDKSSALSEYFFSTDAYSELLQMLKSVVEVANSISSRRTNFITNTGVDISSPFRSSDNRMSLGHYSPLNQTTDDSSHGGAEIEMATFRRNEAVISIHNHSLPPVWNYGNEEQNNGISSLGKFHYGRRFPTTFLSQIIVIFGRRLYAFAPSVKTLSWLLVQMFTVSIVVSITFSYQTSTILETPYQVLMIISMISLYCMILQYLQLIPEYMAERQAIIQDSLSGYMSFTPYMIGAMLTEVPRAILHSVMLMSTVYVIHPLNPISIKRSFAFVCLMVGTTAFQGLISICATVTDYISVSYSIAFLILSAGTIFGGIMVPLEKIIPPFRFFYYTSVTAITQRALITNDMECCYLTATCNQIDHEYDKSPATVYSNRTTSYCPPELEYTGDGSDIGNLGRAYLLALNLQEDRPFIALLALFIASIIFRVIMVFILNKRVGWKDQLKEVK